MNKLRRTTAVMRGFSLVEMAIVLLVLGIALGGLLGAIGQNTETMRRLEAKNKLREIEESLYAYAQVHGRLPCPANDDTSGFEDDLSTTAGTCSIYHGLLPNATLGLSGNVDENGLLMDPWGNPYRYSVAGQTDGGNRYTGSNGIPNIFDDSENEVVSNDNMLWVCNNVNCDDVVLANVVPAIVLSLGNNWGELDGTASAAERSNAWGTYTANNIYPVASFSTLPATFVITDYSELNYDDMLIWISPHILLGKLVTAGKLP